MTTLEDRQAGGEETQPSRRAQLAELLVFLFLIVPSMVLSIFAFRQETAGFALVAAAAILRDLALVSLIFLFLWRNGEPIRRIGWTFAHGWREVGLGVVLAAPFFYLFGWAERAFEAVGLSVPAGPAPAFITPKGSGDFVLAFFLVIVVAITEETIFRGYLILRLSVVTRSLAAAVVLSAVIFLLGHGYEGSAGMATVGLMGVVLALIYVWRRSLVAPMVLHFFQDLLAILILPLLARS